MTGLSLTYRTLMNQEVIFSSNDMLDSINDVRTLVLLCRVSNGFVFENVKPCLV